MIASQKIPPIPYENFYVSSRIPASPKSSFSADVDQVGECRSLIFGVSLTDYDFTRPEGTAHGDPPIIVERCIAEVDQRGQLERPYDK